MTVAVTATVTATETATATTTATETETKTETATLTTTQAPTSPAPGDPAPDTLSLGDLFAAAEEAATRAGVEPADPQEPGPDRTGTCPVGGYSDEEPAGLRADAARAWQRIVRVGAAAGITVCLNDGKRSVDQQEAIHADYVAQYGSQTADELVLPADKSAHIIGLAVDVQPAAAHTWLEKTDGALGMCRMYDNEPWHFEFHPDYPITGCPERLPVPPR